MTWTVAVRVLPIEPRYGWPITRSSPDRLGPAVAERVVAVAGIGGALGIPVRRARVLVRIAGVDLVEIGVAEHLRRHRDQHLVDVLQGVEPPAQRVVVVDRHLA